MKRIFNSYTVLLALLLLCAAARHGSSVYAQNPPPAQFTVYVPVMLSNSNAAPNPPPNPNPTPSPSTDSFVERAKKTYNQSIVVDAQGGTHLAYSSAPVDSETQTLMYAYCPPPASACSDPARWQRVSLPVTLVDRVQLALTRAGEPRIAVRSYATDYRTREFAYGACDGNCLSATSWQLVAIAYAQPDAEAEYYGYLLPTHFFALDGQDRPRFTFANRYPFTLNERRYEQGGYYAQCEADCTNAQNWLIERFTYFSPSDDGFYQADSVVYPSLALTGAGTPRIVAYLSPISGSAESPGLYYFGCDASCESDANWTRAKIAERGNGPHPTWKLVLDGNSQPHVAFYEEPDVTTVSTHRLYYLTCANACERGGAWNTLDVGLPAGAGDGVDMVLDSAGRPRMSYTDTDNSLGYAWCNGDCARAANWQARTIETRPQLEAEFAVPILPSCDGGFWDTLATALALDSAGNPHVAYRGIFQERCYENDPTNPGEPPKFRFKEMWHTVRLARFGQL